MNKETRKTQTWFVDGVELKEHLKTYQEWSFITRHNLESWAVCVKQKPFGLSDYVFMDMIVYYVNNCIQYAKRHKWIRCRKHYPKMFQVIPI